MILVSVTTPIYYRKHLAENNCTYLPRNKHKLSEKAKKQNN